MRECRAKTRGLAAGAPLGRRLAVSALAAAAVALGACGSNSSSSSPPSDAGTGSDAPGVILDGGGVVPSPPDGASLCPKGTCNYQTQSGCGATLACRPALTGGAAAPSCQTAGSKQSGAPCQAWKDCARGYLCAGGACHKLCCGGDWSACGSGQSCIRQLFVKAPDAGAPVSAGVDLCFPVNDCNVLDPNSCADAGSGQSCQIVDPIGDVACTPSGTGTVGAPCSETAPCSGGFSCVGDKCRRLCRAVVGGGQPACPASEGICVHFNRDPAGVGECTPE